MAASDYKLSFCYGSMMGIFWRQFSLSRFASALLHAFGALWLIVEASSFFSNSWGETIKSFWWIFLVVGLAGGIYRVWPKTSVATRISGTDIEVEVRICDLFSLEGALIVGSNTTFDTILENETISPTSVQGQFTKRFCPSIPDLDQHIALGLRNIEPIQNRSREDKPYGKVEEYKFGTVAPVVTRERRAYFVAIARLNAYRVASSSQEDFLDALPRIWAAIRSRGGMEPLCCPILGSGFSRLNLTREEISQEIIKSFVAASLEAKFCEKLTVVIHPKDIQKWQIDLQRVARFLEHECIYARSVQPDSSRPVGIALS